MQRCFSSCRLARSQAHSNGVPTGRMGQLSRNSTIDPFVLLAPHLSELRASMPTLLGSGHPALTELSQYYFQQPAKHIRPVIILLFSQATNGLGSKWLEKKATCNLDRPISRSNVLNDYNSIMPEPTSDFRLGYPLQTLPSSPPSFSIPAADPSILPSQYRLAQIVEMLHTASLLHDDVIDGSPLRRSAPSAPAAYGNKLSVLGGDFVLGRVSAALARLREPEVTQLIASVISNLVEGEILQLRDVKLGQGEDKTDAWNIYLQKTYLKTASLMAKAARSTVVLGGCVEGELWKEIAYAYGRNLGIAFQLVDDILDYESSSTTLGKPGNADLKLGLATGPALYACEEHPEMGVLIQRKFEGPGDIQLARNLVLNSQGVQRTRALAQAYADKALEVLGGLPDSSAKDALEALAIKVMDRRA